MKKRKTIDLGIIFGIIFIVFFIFIISKASEIKNTEETAEMTTEDIFTIDESIQYEENDLSNEITESELDFITETTSEISTELNLDTENLYAEKIGNRGSCASGRSEPKYTNKTGYLSVKQISSIYPKPEIDMINNTTWTVDTFKKIDADHYEVNGTLPHKTKVKVLSQNLEHQGWGNYSGFLTVQNLSDNQEYIISVGNFVLNQYWKNDIVDAIKDGPVICQYNNINKDYLPCDKSDTIIYLPENCKLLAIGKTGVISGLNYEALNIECLYYNEYNEYSTVYINQDNLTILY